VAALWSQAPPGTAAGRRTSFGSVALVGSTRLAIGPPRTDHGAGHASGDGSGDGSAVAVAAAGLVPSIVHGAWTDAVVADVEVRNDSGAELGLSPGQFRVRVDRLGPTVSLYSAEPDAGPVAPHSSRTLQIKYLVPPAGHDVSLEFADVGAAAAVALGPLEGAAARGGSAGRRS